jgi:hypothetical protein
LVGSLSVGFGEVCNTASTVGHLVTLVSRKEHCNYRSYLVQRDL